MDLADPRNRQLPCPGHELERPLQAADVLEHELRRALGITSHAAPNPGAKSKPR